MPSRAESAWTALREAAPPRPKAGAGAGVASLLRLQTPLEKKRAHGSGGGGKGGISGVGKGGGQVAVAAAPKHPAQQASSADAAAMRAAAAAALAAVRPKEKKLVVRTFAGEQVEMVGADAAAAAAVDVAAKAAPPASGLDALVAGVVEKKEGGVSTLKKTQSDWQKVRAEGGAELEDELEAHKRSGKTYLDKQEFLKKAEWTEYERDREAKLKAQGVAR